MSSNPAYGCVLNTTLCDEVDQWLAAGRWFSQGTLVFTTNKTEHYDITVILLMKVALSIIPPLTRQKQVIRKKIIEHSS